MQELSFVAAFIVGLLGSTHCIGMCGGIVGALTMGLPDGTRQTARKLLPFLLLYNLGRLTSYTIAGLVVAVVVTSSGGLFGGIKFPIGGIVGGLFMVALGIYIAGWFQTMAPLEKLGSHFWRLIEPLGRRFLPVHRYRQAVALGFIWGWLPCGLVYSTLAWAATSADLVQTPLLMFAFGLGTLPMLLVMGGLADKIQRFTRHRWTRFVAGVVLILFGAMILFKATSMALGGGMKHDMHGGHTGHVKAPSMSVQDVS